MTQDACPLPDPDRATDDSVARMLAARRIAIVGLSDDPSRASYGVARYLRSVGKEIIPVNPNLKVVFGLECFPNLEAVPGKIDLVDVFRRAEFCPDIVRSALAVGAKGIWLQSGIISDEAREMARKAGVDFVENRCLMVEHMHSGEPQA